MFPAYQDLSPQLEWAVSTHSLVTEWNSPPRLYNSFKHCSFMHWLSITLFIGWNNINGSDLACSPPIKTFPRGWIGVCQHIRWSLNESSLPDWISSWYIATSYIDIQLLCSLDKITSLAVIWHVPRPPRPFPVVAMGCVNTFVGHGMNLPYQTELVRDTLQLHSLIFNYFVHWIK
jgi:hypothetical protein